MALWACTPAAGYHYCAQITQSHTQVGSSTQSNFSVGIIGTANGSAGTGAFSGSNVDLRTAANGGKIQNTVPIGGLLSGLYKSGGTITGTVGQTCAVGSFNNGSSGAAAYVILTGPNSINANASLIFTVPGTSATSDPTSATLSVGGPNPASACSGTITVDVLFATFVTPADITITSDSAGTTILRTCEVASYSASTGQFEGYQMQTLSDSADTVWYISFGNSSVTASQCDIVTAWKSSYAFVGHNSSLAFSGSDIIQVLDSTLNDNYPANAGSTYTKTTGVAGDGLLAHDSASHLNVNATTNFAVGSGARGLMVWMNTGNAALPSGIKEIGGFGTGNSIDKYWGLYGSDNTYSARNTLVGELFADDALPSTDFPQDSAWHQIVFSYPSGQTQVQYSKMYLDGAALSVTLTHPTNTLNTGGGSQGSFCIGCNPSGGTAIGTFSYDEWRVWNVEPTADEILSIYNNYNAPGTFVSVSNFTAVARVKAYIYVR